MKRMLVIVAFSACVFSAGIFALDVPPLDGPVNDLAGVLSAAQRSSLSEYLLAVNSQTGVQVAVLTVKSLKGDSLESFSMRVADKWQLGQAGEDNGALLLVAVDDRDVRIEVGYGLEGNLTDAKSGLIIRNVIIPHFRNNNYASGIRDGVENIVGVATGNAAIVAETVKNPPRNESGGEWAGFLFMFIFFMLINSRRFLGRRGGGILGALFAANVISNATRSSGRSSSGFRSGGFSGGGFSGGGGGFGGGGASGSW